MKINLVSFNPLAADIAGNARKAAKLLSAYLEDGLTPEEIVKKLRVKKETVFDVLERVNRADLKRRQTAPCLQVAERSFSSLLRPIIKKVNL